MKPADALIVIPARWGSSRLPGKPLEQLAGRPLIEHTWRAACRTGIPVTVATDDTRIADVIDRLGGGWLMTPRQCRNGTERCQHAARALGHSGPIVNWQGDSPLVPAAWIRNLLAALQDPDVAVATPVQLCDPAQAERIRSGAVMGQPAATTAVLDPRMRCLYFSKAAIPYRGPYWLHVGIYAYASWALAAYGAEESHLERSEQLEQLRFIESGFTVRGVPVDGPAIWEVNTPGDVAIVERMMGERGEIAGAPDWAY